MADPYIEDEFDPEAAIIVEEGDDEFDPEAAIIVEEGDDEFDPEAAVVVEEGLEDQSWIDKGMAYGENTLEGLLFGWGSEAAAIGRTGYGMLFEALDPRLEMENFHKKLERERARGNKAREIQYARDPVGMTGAYLAGAIPGAAKLSMAPGNMATRWGNVGVQGGIGAAEMAVREVGEGEGSLSERVSDIDPSMVVLGAGTAGSAGGLMKGQKAVDEMLEAEKSLRNADGSLTNKGFEQESNLSANARHIRDDLYTNVKTEVGAQEARQLVASDAASTIAKQELHTAERLPHEAIDSLAKAFDTNPTAAKRFADAGAVGPDGLPLIKSEGGRKAMLDWAGKELAKTDPKAAEAFAKMRTELDTMSAQLQEVFPNIKFEGGYAPITFKNANPKKPMIGQRKGVAPSGAAQTRETGLVSKDQAANVLNNPVHSFMNRWEDTADALALAKEFGVTVPTKSLDGVHSFTESVITQIGKDYTEKLGAEGAERLVNNLRLFAINGKQGMGPWMQMLRVGTSAALLGTPENAMLQMGDLGAAAYNNTFMSAVKSLPAALKSMLLTNGENIVVEGYGQTLRAPDLGISGQHYGELFRQSEGGWGDKTLRTVSDKIMKYMGVKSANRLGQEVNINASLDQMKGYSREALAKSQYAEGLPADKIDELYEALQAGDPRHPAIKEAAFFSLGRIQPLSRTAVPAKYLEMENGRLLYSMKMYMAKMASRAHTDVFQPMKKAHDLGLNTDAGRKEMGKALKNSARYTGFLVALNSVVDPGRKEVFRGIENENTFGEEMARQGTSFVTGGLVDLNRIEEHGIVQGMVPPAAAAAASPVEFVIRRLMSDDEFSEDELTAMARNMPGLRQLMWADDVASGPED